MKLCTDCAHYAPHDTFKDQPRLGYCTRKSYRSRVDGTVLFYLAGNERGSTTEKDCGPEAQFFKARDIN